MANLTFSISPPGPLPFRPVFTPQQVEAVKKAFKFENVEVFTEDEAKEKGPLGHLIMMPLAFDETEWTKYTASGDQRFTTKEMALPVALVDINRSKNLERTALEGSDGDVIEFGSFGNYDINIRTVLINEDGTYPEQQFKDLMAIEAAQAMVGITSDVLIWLNVNYVVIHKVNLVAMEGIENAQAIELNCISDMPRVLVRA